MSDKNDLYTMVDAIMDQKTEDGQIAFHNYLQSRISTFVHGMHGTPSTEPESESEVEDEVKDEA